MAKFELLRNINQGAATLRAAKNVLENNSAVRVITAGKEILRGERDIPQNPQDAVNLLFDVLFGSTPDPYQYVSKYDTPVRNYILFNGSSYPVLNRDGFLAQISYPTLLIDSAVIRVGMRKNIQRTAINGRNGTRKEYISDGDFNIDIKGVIASDTPYNYPHDAVNDLRKVLLTPEPVTVISPALARWGISTIVIDAFDIPQEEGYYNKQEFAIRAISHEPNDAFIETKNKATSRLQQVIDKAVFNEVNLKPEVKAALNKFFEESEIPEGNALEDDE